MGEDLTGHTLLGKYRIDGLLGQGGMGSVWRGEHTRTGRQVAVKLLDERFLTNASVVQRFGREARAASAIQHPGIVEVLDLDQTETGVPFLVMELLPGYPLSTRIETKGRLPLDETMSVMEQLLEALEVAHVHGVIHRDLKPDNIVLIPRRRQAQLLKILDFGISQKSDERVQNLTVAGTVLGTPHYMAPEQAMGDAHVDCRVDLYSAAIVMYECLTGDVPFDADNYNALIHVILNEEPPPPSTRGAEIGQALERALLRCMAKEKTARPASAKEMLALLHSARNRDELDAPPRSEPPVAAAPSPVPPPSDSDSAMMAARRVATSVPTMDPMSTSSGSFAVGDLVIKRTPKTSKRPRPATSLPPPDTDDKDAFDPLSMDASSDSSLELDESVIHKASRSLAPRSTRSASGGYESPRPAPRTSLPAPKQARPGEAKSTPIAWYMAGGLLLFVAAILAARFAFSGSSDPGIEPNPISVVEHPTDPHVEPADDGRVAIDVSGLPPGASVRLDGLPTQAFPLRVRRGTSHVLDVSAPGYQSREIEFTADADKRLSANLRPAVGIP